MTNDYIDIIKGIKNINNSIIKDINIKTNDQNIGDIIFELDNLNILQEEYFYLFCDSKVLKNIDNIPKLDFKLYYIDNLKINHEDLDIYINNYIIDKDLLNLFNKDSTSKPLYSEYIETLKLRFLKDLKNDIDIIYKNLINLNAIKTF